jgi:hypothetical protein
MSTTFYRLGRGPAAGGAAELEGRDGDEIAGARRRLTLAVLWLGGLIAWGLFSYVTDPPADERGSAPVAAAQLDGHGKWTGQTAGWRSRSQILQDAGVVRSD